MGSSSGEGKALSPLQTYEQAIDFLYGRINYERVQSQAYSSSDLKLDRMRQLLELLGDPHERIPAVHVTGTKGKGSTCSMIASVLAAAGFRVGLFTSPHLVHFEERMRVNGVSPAQAELLDLVNTVREPVARMDRAPGSLPPTYFEIATALAWLYFTRQQAEIAVLEVGLGGRLDATNLCRPEVCVITNISRDHMHLLGSTVPQIAAEKGGIIKPGVPLVSGAADPEASRVLEEMCGTLGSAHHLLGRDIQVLDDQTAPGSTQRTISVQTGGCIWSSVPVPLYGAHQAVNAALAVAAIDQMQQRGWDVSEDALRTGMAAVKWPARIEVLRRSPTVIVDAAHNWESIAALVRTLRAEFRARRRVLVFAATRDKDVRGLLRQLLPEFDTIILTRYLDNPRAVPCDELEQLVATISGFPVHVAPEPAVAWKLAQRLAGPDDLICITGSFFIAAELRELIVDQKRGEPELTQNQAEAAI